MAMYCYVKWITYVIVLGCVVCVDLPTATLFPPLPNGHAKNSSWSFKNTPETLLKNNSLSLLTNNIRSLLNNTSPSFLQNKFSSLHNNILSALKNNSSLLSKNSSQPVSPSFLRIRYRSFWKTIFRISDNLRNLRQSRANAPVAVQDRFTAAARCYVDLATLRISLGLRIPWALESAAPVSKGPWAHNGSSGPEDILLLRVKLCTQHMTDATSRPGSGYMDHDFDALGVDDECLEAPVPKGLGFQPEYAVVTLNPLQARIPSVMRPSPVTGLSMGLCLPDSCQEEQIKTIIRGVLKEKNISGYMDVQDVYIRTTNDIGLSGAATGVVAFLVMWVVVIIACTICDYIHERSKTSRSRMRPKALPEGRALEQGLTVQKTRKSKRAAFKQSEQVGANGRAIPAQDRDKPSTSQVLEELAETDEVEEEDLEQARRVSRARSHTPSEHMTGILRGQVEVISASASPHPAISKLESLVRLMQCFSLHSNVPKLFDTTSTGTEVGCLHGIRVMSCSWVILVNTLLLKALYLENALRLMNTWRDQDFVYAFCGNGLLSLESLFAISGVLVGYSGGSRVHQQTSGLGWFIYILHRYGRIVPTLLIVGVVYLSLFPHVTSGPLWTEHAPGYDACLKWGWMDALLVHNYAPSVCLPWTWFFAVDFQLFLLSPILLVLLYRTPRAAHVLVVALVLAGWVAGGVVTQYHRLPVSQFLLPDLSGSSSGNATNVEDYGRMYLYQPYAHIGSFYPPLLLGYSLYSSRQRASLGKRTVVLGWAAALAGMVLAVFATRKHLVGAAAPNIPAFALYNAVHRTVWSAGVCWVVLACSTGHGGLINSVLSWRLWKPVSRLVFVAYLVHPMIILIHNACLQQMVYLTTASAVYHMLGVLVTSFAVSLLVTTLIEMPITGALRWATESCVEPRS